MQDKILKYRYMKKIKKSLQKIFKKLSMIINFANMNILAIKHIAKECKRTHGKLKIQALLAPSLHKEGMKRMIKESKLHSNQKQIKNLKNEVEDSFLHTFYKDNREEGIQKLKDEI